MRALYCSLLSLCFLCSGCIFVPFIESVKEIGATASHRKQKLERDLKEFHNALYWGERGRAASYVASEAVDKDAVIGFDRKKERLVDMKIERVDYSEDAFEAEVTVLLRAYSNATLLVQERLEREEWLFSVTDGWKIVSRTAKKEA